MIRVWSLGPEQSKVTQYRFIKNECTKDNCVDIL